jgi:NADH-quinone oxidoreductase subunit K
MGGETAGFCWEDGMIPLAYFIGLSVIMFVFGILGVLLRRNSLVVFMSLELMFNAANLLFVTFAAYYGTLTGQLTVFFVMTVAAAEVAVGLALMVEIFRSKHSIDVDQMNNLKG